MTTAPFRLAFRQEGSWWNVYIAKTETMVDAILFASVRLQAIKDKPGSREFVDLMKTLFQRQLEGQGIEVLGMDERPGPEDERSGHA